MPVTTGSAPAAGIVAARFAEAAARYDAAAVVQRAAAQQFAEWLAGIQPPPASIAEIGCGTGFLTAALRQRYPAANYTASDLAPAMLERCRGAIEAITPASSIRYLLCDGRDTRFAPPPDWIVSAMCFQWLQPLEPLLTHHLGQCRVLAFSLPLDGSFASWREAHARLGLDTGLLALPRWDDLLAWCGGQGRTVHSARITLRERFDSPLDFARSLRAIGADTSASRHRTRAVPLRRIARTLPGAFEVNHEIGFFCLKVPVT